MDDPYNTKVKPNNFWISENCEWNSVDGWKMKYPKHFD